MNQKIFNRQWLEENLPLILSFVLPMLVLTAVFAGNRIFPFGDNSFLRVDLYHQYAPFLSAMKQKLSAGGSLSYTWDVGLGTNFLSLYGYYLASPFNWLLVLFPLSGVLEFLSYMVVCKTGLTGLFFAYYLYRKSGKKDYYTTFFGIFFALSGYFAAYNWNIMWVDCIMLTPLILLGLELLVKEGRCWLYCVSLALCILSNYYIAIMVCMFCVLYFIVLVISMPFCRQRTITAADGARSTVQTQTPYTSILVNFCLFSLLAGGLAACLVIPEMMALRMTASGTFSFPKEWTSYFSIFDMLARHMALVDTEIGLDHWPNIYCGTVVFAALPLYLMNRTVPWREKAAKMALLLFMLFSFSTNIPNYIWHGFHFPNSLPCRQSFLYIAVLLTMCYEGARGLPSRTTEQITGAFTGAFVFVILAQKLVSAEEIPFQVYFVALIFLGLYLLVYCLRRNGQITHPMTVVLLLSLAVIETTANTACTSISTVSRSNYLNHTTEFRQLVERVRTEDPGFYRFEKCKRRSKNDGAWVGYPSASIFSSTANAALTDLYKALGLEGSMNAYAVTGMTPFISSIFNIKYMLASEMQSEQGSLQFYAEQNGAYLYRNQYALPAGFMVPADMDTSWTPENMNQVTAQNAFSIHAAGTGNLLEPIANTNTNGGTFEIYPEEAGHIFVMVESSQVEDVKAQIGDRSLDWSDVDRGYLLDLGFCNPEDIITLTTEQNTALIASAYLFRYDNLNTMVQILRQQGLQITAYTDTRLDGTITVQEDGLLFTSIPYDDGWTLKVDGETTEIKRFADALISVPLTAGVHEIHLEYRAPGQSLGLLVTFATLIMVCLILLAEYMMKREQTSSGAAETEEEADNGTDKESDKEGTKEETKEEIKQETIDETNEQTPREISGEKADNDTDNEKTDEEINAVEPTDENNSEDL